MKKEIQKETKKTSKKKIILIGLISALALLIITIAIKIPKNIFAIKLPIFFGLYSSLFFAKTFTPL